MIDDHHAEQSEAGEHQEAAGDPGAFVPSTDPPPPPDDRERGGDPPPPDDLPVAAAALEKADDLGRGEAERALLEWALRQRQNSPGEPLLPRFKATTPEAAPRPTARPRPEADWGAEPGRDAGPGPGSRGERDTTPGPMGDAAFEPADDEPHWPWEMLYDSAEDAISALVAAGGPDPRDFASPRLTRRAKLVIALALVVLFVVSALGGFVGYRVTHRAARGGPEAVGGLAEVRSGAALVVPPHRSPAV